MLSALDHITLSVRDLNSAVERYSALLGCNVDERRTGAVDGAWLQLDNVSLKLIAPNNEADRQEEGIAALAFATTDLARDCHVLNRRGIATTLGSKTTADLSNEATYGVNIAIVERESSGSSHARSPYHRSPDVCVSGLDHIVITTSHPERAAALYGARLGLDMKLDRTNAAWGSRLMFFKCGDLIVEIAHSLQKADPGADDKAWGLSWRVPNIDAARERIAAAGFDVSEVRTGRKPGTRVCTVRNAPGNMPTILIGRD